MPTALMYHDIVPLGAEDSSGFPGRDAARYKVAPEQFEAHLKEIAASPALPALTITFDDGGASALRAADMLERFGIRGCFFVTANYIGTGGFLDRAGMRQLHARGHVVGSHSCSHPLRMGRCSREQLRDEWTRSRTVISDILGAPIAAASVPGGDYAGAVGEEAAAAGYTTLFTSEPTSRVQHVRGLTLYGRYAILRWTTAAAARQLATGARWARARQAAAWNAKKLGKRVAGPAYLQLRKLLLRHGDEVQWGDRVV